MADLRAFENTLIYGCDYNPEQWPESVWQEDMALMKRAGVNLVSIAIFGWARLEPEEGVYEFAWLDRIMDMLHQHGIKANLATATASPPAWFALKYPESLPVDKNGVRLGVGSRQQYSPASPIYREKASQLVRQLALRYKNHSALAMWHINNEYGCHIFESFSEETVCAFRNWLHHKYATLDALNEAWGTAFWSQTYYEWAEIQAPAAMPTFYNPSQYLDWRRFSSDMLQECMQMEVDLLREITPEVPVTTNYIGINKHLDQWKMSEIEDVVSIDIYPDPASPSAAIECAAQGDVARSLKQNQPWILMEQAPNQVQWRTLNHTKRPGQMRLWSYQLLARGARGIMYFQWRQSKAGAEKYHSGMVPHDGTDSRTWREIETLGNELKRLPDFCNDPVKAEVAIVLDWNSWWGLEQGSHPHADLNLMELVAQFYAPLHQQNITVQFVRPSDDLSKYRLVCIPNLYLVKEEDARNIETYVQNGGRVVMSYFSGIVNEHDHVYLGGYPAPFRKMLGLKVEEWLALSKEEKRPLENGWSAEQWIDVIRLEGAQAVTSHTADYYAGLPAITTHAFGAGRADYLGVKLPVEQMGLYLKTVLDELQIQPALQVPAGIEVVSRETTVFVLNHHPQTMTIDLPEHKKDLLSGKDVAGQVELPAYGVLILQ